jgi:hypothetical protein
MSCLFSAMTVHVIRRHSADARISADADRKLRQNMTNLVQLDKILPMAGWIHRRYTRILEREGEEDVPVSPLSLTGDALAIVPMPPMLVSQRSPSLPPPTQMRTIKVEEPTTVAAAGNGAEDEWGDDCGPILNLEHSLTATNGQLEHHLGNGDNGLHQQQQQQEEEEEEEEALRQRQARQRQHHQQQQQLGADDLNGMMPDPTAMQPDIFDDHWFMENIGDIANPF